LTSLGLAFVLLFKCLLIPPCWYSFSNYNISASTSTSLPFNVKLYSKQQHVTTSGMKRIWRLFLNNNILKVFFNIPKAFFITFLLERCLLYNA
jgi:hypothetical protein